MRYLLLIFIWVMSGAAQAQPGGCSFDTTHCLVTPSGVSPSFKVTMARISAAKGVPLETYQRDGASDLVALQRACGDNANAGVPILLSGKQYFISDFDTASGCATNFNMVGVPNLTRITRQTASSGAFFHIRSANIYVTGVFFDANGSSGGLSGANQWGVLVNSGGQKAYFDNDGFGYNNGSSLGFGLAILGTGPAGGGAFTVTNSEFVGSHQAGATFRSVSNGFVAFNQGHDNTAGAGMTVGVNGTVSSSNYSTNITLASNETFNNTNGIIVGGISPPYDFTTQWAATDIRIYDNNSYDNSTSDYTTQGDHLVFKRNKIGQVLLSSATYGLLCNSAHSQYIDNTFDIATTTQGVADCGGSVDPVFQLNYFKTAAASALNIGGSSNALVQFNKFVISGNSTAVSVNAIEGDGNGTAFTTVTSGFLASDNNIYLSGSGAVGFHLYDNAGGYPNAVRSQILRNHLFTSGGVPTQSTLIFNGAGQSLTVRDNEVNGLRYEFVDPNGAGDVIFDPIYDNVQPPSSFNTVRAVVSRDIATYGGGGFILYGNPLTGGANYPSSGITVTFHCVSSGPTGAVGRVLLNSGAIVGLQVSSPGNGDCVGGSPSVTLGNVGSGSGATFAVSNQPNIPADKTLSFYTGSFGNNVQLGGGFIGINNPSSGLFLNSVNAPSVLQLTSGPSGSGPGLGPWGVLTPSPEANVDASSSFVGTGRISGNSLVIDSLSSGAVAINQYVKGSGLAPLHRIVSGTDSTHWTLNNSSQSITVTQAITGDAFPDCTNTANSGTDATRVHVTNGGNGQFEAGCNGTSGNWYYPNGTRANP